MICVECNRPDYEYDLHSLIKSFYPEQSITFNSDKDECPDLKITVISANESCRVKIYSSDKNLFEDSMVSDETDENIKKRLFKRFFYDALKSVTGKELPWGNLTGVRPTKIARSMFENGDSENTVREFLQGIHEVSDSKTDLCIDIAKREMDILSSIDAEDGYSLYIGIPFCPTTCLYCSFTSNPISKWKDRMDEYLDCLIKELRFVGETNSNRKLNTIYIGGGTPTSISAQQLDRLISAVEENFDFKYLREFTVEAGRPDSITRDKLRVLREHNISRISVNPQSMNQETLDRIGRRHTVDETVEAFKMARSEGMDNINMDIILGLPGETGREVARTIDEILKLGPDSLTVHSLAIKRAAKMSSWIETNGRSDLHFSDDMMEIATKGAHDMGMLPYYLYRQKNMAGNLENVGFAKSDKYGIYNILIMEEVQTIVAVGAGSVSKRVYPDGRIERCDNVKDVALYIDKIDEMIERKRILFGEFEQKRNDK